MKTLFRFFLVTFFLLIILFGVVVYSVLFTNFGIRKVADHILPYAGVHADDIQGTVWDGLLIGNLLIDKPTLKVDAQGIAIKLNLAKLKDRQIYIESFTSRNLNMQIVAKDTKEIAEDVAKQVDKAEGSVIEYPTLPVDIIVERASLYNFAIQQTVKKDNIFNESPPMVEIAGSVENLKLNFLRRKHLDFNIDSELSLTGQGYRITSKVVGEGSGTNPFVWDKLDLKAELDDKSLLFNQAVIGKAQIRIDSRRQIDPLVDLLIGDNQLHIDGSLPLQNGVKTKGIVMRATAPKLDRMAPGAGKSLTLEATITGDIQNHEFKLNGIYVPLEDFALGADDVHIDIEATGKGTDNSWASSISKIDIHNKDNKISNSSPIPIDIQFGPPAEWKIGQATLVFARKGMTDTVIVHESTNGVKNQIFSQGIIKDLKYEDQLFNARWDLKKAPLIETDLFITRNGEEALELQKNPLLNIKELHLNLKGTPEEKIIVNLNGDGESTKIKGDFVIDPKNILGFDTGELDIELSNGTLLKGNLGPDVTDKESLAVNLNTNQLDIGLLSGGLVKDSIINGNIAGVIKFNKNKIPTKGSLYLDIDKNSKWLGKPISGLVDFKFTPFDEETVENTTIFTPVLYIFEKADANLKIGSNTIVSKGAFGRPNDKLEGKIEALNFKELWPTLEGAAKVEGFTTGTAEQHTTKGKLQYAPKGFSGKKPQVMTLSGAVTGGLISEDSQVKSWKGKFTELNSDFDKYNLKSKDDIEIEINKEHSLAELSWKVTNGSLNLTMPNKHVITLSHIISEGQGKRWRTAGEIKNVVIDEHLKEFTEMLEFKENSGPGGIVVKNPASKNKSDLKINAQWGIEFNESMRGGIVVNRVSGDFVLPRSNNKHMGIQDLSLQAIFEPSVGNKSDFKTTITLNTKTTGQLKINAKVPFVGLQPLLRSGTEVTATGKINDISWVSAFTDDLLELGGEADFDIRLHTKSDGNWTTTGYLNAKDLKIVEVENGVRFLNGTLNSHLDSGRYFVDDLTFPSVIRVKPSEVRTKAMLDKLGSKGYFSLSGFWDLVDSVGEFKVDVDKYPIVQRSDRFIMVSGNGAISAPLPQVDISGNFTTDTGFASVDILESTPKLDSDIIILKEGEANPAPRKTDTNLNLDVNFNLGDHFHIVGLGLDSKVKGSLNIIKNDGPIKAVGMFETDGGKIEAYGQKLSIDKGEITFNGSVENPSFDIEAIRKGLEVEAGVRVQGNARLPKISLVSYPDVSEVEKLSWLIMGRGPDSSGADLALLLSIGTELLGGEEPLYRQIGIDNIGVRSGTVGASGAILPQRSVADSTSYRGSDTSDQLLYISKQVTENWSAALEQSISGGGTVVRASYKLFENITADIKAGSVNGIELIYKRVFKF
ncbi:translocation/assembly module TamB domain-containing protein [Taylorella equigenitalis]|uniref:Translocation and assembly module TamB C-terminal domain-containing protein n=1 Tax=Taylorella equigenitalis ATCC 35865 TaxID=743973 RepID=A0ABM5N938_9BURK|nr:translocation/assembly module TamB domain-containing protein [Taylorella equigenitalis]AFN35429.1 hypothetical protein KUI_0335 [Taylorella equigenitalis ATCC 35865]ASY38857.1 DUF490 domain-containing protein [Taylorella equigenitalis]VEG30464.1 Family of uncharacterised function (DUF490) [Taylorella equigenitalis ATCC 35865]